MHRLLFRAAALSCLILISACSGRSIGRDHALDYFTSHRAGFDQLIEQIELCQPWSGRIDRTTRFECQSTGGNGSAVVSAMTAVDAQWIRVSYYGQIEGEPRRIASVRVTMHSEGMAFAGIIESFVFETEPALEAGYERTDDGFADIQRMPVTDAPHHWFWQHMRRR